MALTTHKLAAATAVAAAFSLLATPVAAVELPRAHAAQAFDSDALNAERGGRHGRHHDDDWDIDAGDVVAGVVVLGALAALFGATQRANQQRHYPEPEPDAYPDDVDYVPPLPRDRYESVGISGAVDACVEEVERRGDRIGGVSGANRDGEGWYVSGDLANGSTYWCRLDSYGQVSEVGGSGVGYAEPVEQYDDEYYDEARRQQLVKEQAGTDVGG